MIKVDGYEIEFEKFPNGETKLVIDSLPLKYWKLDAKRVSFKYESDEDLIKLMFLKNYYDSMDAVIEELLIYYMPYSRMDRSENDSAFTLKYMANFINNLNFKKVIVVEPHSDVTNALLDRVEPRYINFELVEMVKDEVYFKDEDYLVFPDAGASKRYSKMVAKNVLVGHKNRNFETGKILGLDLVGNRSEKAKKAIIVDDMSSYGTTFIYTAKALREQFGIHEIYLLVAHAENAIFKVHPVTKDRLFNHISKIFTTDSILTEQNDWANKTFESQLKIYNIEEVLV